MTDAEYVLTQERLFLVSRMIANMDLDGFLERLNRAEVLGPVLDPTLFIQGATRFDAIKRIARAAKELQVAAKSMAQTEEGKHARLDD